jgi:hypothetical protein
LNYNGHQYSGIQVELPYKTNHMTLVKWNYTKEEWKNFRQWKQRERGFLFYLYCRLAFLLGIQIPEIRISSDRVWFNDKHEPFQNSHCRFMEIQIREAGSMNVLEIAYEDRNRNKLITVPIPSGKLKEAFAVRERLIYDVESIG